MTVKLALAAAALLAVSLTPARAELIDKTSIGAWKGGAISRDGVVNQCILAQSVAAAPPSGGYVVFQSISRASGFAVAVDDRGLPQQPGQHVDVVLSLDGTALPGVEGKAVGASVVAAYPPDAAEAGRGLAAAKSVTLAFAGVAHDIPLGEEARVMAWLTGCARTHGLAAAAFNAGRDEAEKQLGN